VHKIIRRRLLPAMLAATTLFSGNARAIENVAEIRVGELARATGSRIGLTGIDVKSGRRIQQLSQERFPMCSTFKLLAVAAVLQRADAGKEKLDRFVSYNEKDLLEYAPVTRQHVQEGGMTLGALCQAAIEQSDNTAANLVLQTIGGPAGVTKFARSIGDQVTRLDRNEPALNDWSVGDDRDTTSPATICEDLRRLLLTAVLSQESRDRLNHWLESSQTSAALIRASVPPSWRVGDKSGRSRAGATNDVAVIYPPDGAPIFVAIYILNASTSDEQRSTTLSTVAGFVCEAFRPDPTK
jgi:beta-lactamase class A